ncbi:MAG: hypothetical protein ACREDH_02245 [Methylocella sp.]
MADDVTITFTADVSGLQQGMQQATSAVEATTSALRNGAAQINASFASLPQAYGSAAANIEELASKSALRRLDIERNANQQIAADYRRSFEEIGSIVSSSIMGMITSHQSLKQTAIKILDQILSMFIKSQVKMVAESRQTSKARSRAYRFSLLIRFMRRQEPAMRSRSISAAITRFRPASTSSTIRRTFAAFRSCRRRPTRFDHATQDGPQCVHMILTKPHVCLGLRRKSAAA